MKKIVVVLLCVLVIASVAGCSAMNRAYTDTGGYAEATTDYTVEEPAVDDYAPAAEYEYEYEESGELAKSEEAGLNGLPSIDIPETDRKLIYSASFQITTKNYDADYSAIKTELGAVNGYVQSENSYTTGAGTRHSSFTLRVPVSDYDAFLDAISGIGKIMDKQISTEDVSDSYYDTEARIEILEQRKERLMEHLDRATKMSDIIELEAELSDVLYEIDQHKGTKRHLDNLVDYTTVGVELNEEVSVETITPDGDEPLGDRASNAFSLAMTEAGKTLEDFVVGLAGAVPVLIVIAIIVVVVLVIVRVSAKRARARREKNDGNNTGI